MQDGTPNRLLLHTKIPEESFPARNRISRDSHGYLRTLPAAKLQKAPPTRHHPTTVGYVLQIHQADSFSFMHLWEQKYKIINVARIEKTAKRQHLLIKAFSLLADEFPEWGVELWGGDDVKGVYTKELRTLIQKKHLEERVFLKGKTDQVLSAYLNADIFAFPSAYEGFGMALAEAMSAGLPAVAYRSCPAVNEIVRNEMSGLLVDDGVEAFAAGLRKLMTCQELRSKMGAAAKKEMEQYAPEKVWDRWETLFAEVVAKHTQG